MSKIRKTVSLADFRKCVKLRNSGALLLGFVDYVVTISVGDTVVDRTEYNDAQVHINSKGERSFRAMNKRWTNEKGSTSGWKHTDACFAKLVDIFFADERVLVALDEALALKLDESVVGDEIEID